MSLEFITKIVTSFSQNSRLVYCSETKEGILLDPAGAVDSLIQDAEKLGVKIIAVWLTHAHPDHCGAVAEIKRRLNIPLYAHAEGRALRSNVVQFMAMIGVPDKVENCPEPDIVLKDGDVLSLGNYTFKAIHTPGHSPDHLCYYCEQEKILFSGDTLFAGAVGRTDLPGGSSETLKGSLKKIVSTLSPETTVYAGHGVVTDLASERSSNPYLQF